GREVVGAPFGVRARADDVRDAEHGGEGAVRGGGGARDGEGLEVLERGARGGGAARGAGGGRGGGGGGGGAPRRGRRGRGREGGSGGGVWAAATRGAGWYASPRSVAVETRRSSPARAAAPIGSARAGSPG